LVGFDVSQQQINLIRRFNSNVQTPDSAITRVEDGGAQWVQIFVLRLNETIYISFNGI
jgi:hypothetical protein